mmetsp:Transcript_45055/g.65864  ORF Transcript_45055/g.65864 Transcript_45055/m.65864 type:complete len:84 (-) Transcript_45055:200-451(-)
MCARGRRGGGCTGSRVGRAVDAAPAGTRQGCGADLLCEATALRTGEEARCSLTQESGPRALLLEQQHSLGSGRAAWKASVTLA